MSIKPIGGYFELELSNIDNFPHKSGIFVNTGRNALELILRNIGNIKVLYIPYFTCDVVLEPISKLNIPYCFYNINNDLELSENIILDKDEYILYTNYFGIKDTYIKELEIKYKDKLIIDNAQALYSEPTTKCLYSPRKFVGIPDSGIAYINNHFDLNSFEIDESCKRFSHLLIRHENGATAGYSSFKEKSGLLKNQPIKQISILTRKLLSSIDFNIVRAKRIENFNYLHSHLRCTNLLNIDSFNDFACPMVYPYYTNDNTLKSKLIENKIFVATYWPNVFEWCKQDDIEYKLANNIISIPIDQRYGIEDMSRIVKEILLWGLL